MEVNLICSENIRKILEEILENRNINIKQNSKMCIVEKGFDFLDGCIAIYFDMNTLNLLMEFLDELGNKKEHSKDIITGKCKDVYSIITYDKILYFEGMGNEVFCVTRENKYQIREKLYEIEKLLNNKGFIRVSKAAIVNIVKVKKIIPWFNGKLVLKMEGTDEEIHVSRSYAKEFKNFLGI